MLYAALRRVRMNDCDVDIGPTELLSALVLAPLWGRAANASW
jgi:hypothetical protein